MSVGVRVFWLGLAAAAACSRSGGVADEDLGGLVVAAKPVDAPIDVARAASDPGELGRALARPFRAEATALGPHALTIETQTDVATGGAPVSTLADKTVIELGEAGAWHAVYTNSADYGREATAPAGGKDLYLRPRYQRWHHRAPETPEEPGQLEDSFAGALGATWDLVAPGVELTDLGAVQVGARAGRKIAVKLAPQPRAPDAEPLPQRKWREHRRVEALAGEVVLDTDKGVPLSVQLSGTVGFTRDGKPYEMKLTLTSAVAGIGTAVAITTPADADSVATPERLREVDDRDFLLQGMAPASRAKPSEPAGSGAGSGSGSAARKSP